MVSCKKLFKLYPGNIKKVALFFNYTKAYDKEEMKTVETRKVVVNNNN